MSTLEELNNAADGKLKAALIARRHAIILNCLCGCILLICIGVGIYGYNIYNGLNNYITTYERETTQLLIEKDQNIKSLNAKINTLQLRLNKQDPTHAIEDFIAGKKPELDPALRKMYAKVIVKYSKKFGFPPELIASLIFRESGFHEGALSSKACFGLTQIHPIHTDKFKKLGISKAEAHHVENNIHLGCMILREYFDKEQDIRKALTRYVGGKHPTYVSDILGYTVDSLINPPLGEDSCEKKTETTNTKVIPPKTKTKTKK